MKTVPIQKPSFSSAGDIRHPNNKIRALYIHWNRIQQTANLTQHLPALGHFGLVKNMNYPNEFLIVTFMMRLESR